MRAPNFFIIGAPKCGTSAMASYLAENPQVYFSRLKEPFFWAADLPRVQEYFGITALDDYLRLFARAETRHVAVGEGSTCYLASAVAVPKIVDFNPESRFLVMLRDPVAMLPSWHQEMVYGFHEDVTDFEEAWGLQEMRSNGSRLPPTCLAPMFLQYRQAACYAAQLEPVMRLVAPDRLKIVLFEELSADPRRTYADVCRFLNVDDDGRTAFAPVRQSQSHACRLLSRFIMRPPGWFGPAALALRRRAHQKPAGWLSNAKRFLRRKKQRTPLRPDFERHLRDTLAPEVRRLEELLGRSLEVWGHG